MQVNTPASRDLSIKAELRSRRLTGKLSWWSPVCSNKKLPAMISSATTGGDDGSAMLLGAGRWQSPQGRRCKQEGGQRDGKQPSLAGNCSDRREKQPFTAAGGELSAVAVSEGRRSPVQGFAGNQLERRRKQEGWWCGALGFVSEDDFGWGRRRVRRVLNSRFLMHNSNNSQSPPHTLLLMTLKPP